MKFHELNPPRAFVAGLSGVKLRHVADVILDADEVLTFKTESGAEYDVSRKVWGFYATPSIDSRLKSNGFRPCLVRSTSTGRRFVLLVDANRFEQWHEYMKLESMEVVAWLDSDDLATREG